MGKEPMNALLQEIADEDERGVRTKAKSVLRRIVKGLANRREWIRKRQDQIARLEAIQQEVYKAYDSRDEATLDKLAKEATTIKESYEED